MPYSPTTWQDRVVQYPQRYGKTGETSTEVTLTASPGTVTQAGTPINATNMNKIEAGIAAALPRDGSAAMTGQILTIQSASYPLAIGPVGDTNTGIYFPAAETIGFKQNNYDALRISSNGFVGFGTVSPTAPIDVLLNTITFGNADVLKMATSQGGLLSVAVSNDSSATPTWRLVTGTSEPVAIWPGGTESIQFLTSGQVALSSNGTQTAPVITRTTDTNTGIYFEASDKLAFTEGGKGITLDELKMMGSMGGML